MIKIICDRCKSEMKDVSRIWHMRPKVIECKEDEGMHFCPDCAREIKSFAGKQKEEPVEHPTGDQETEQEQGQEESKKRKRIDIGKAVALKRAGWSNKDIASEMGLKTQTVANAISLYKKKYESMKQSVAEARESQIEK